jgi:hypothetical protein
MLAHFSNVLQITRHGSDPSDKPYYFFLKKRQILPLIKTFKNGNKVKMNEIRARTIEISERCKILTENDDEVIKIEALVTSILVGMSISMGCGV